MKKLKSILMWLGAILVGFAIFATWYGVWLFIHTVCVQVVIGDSPFLLEKIFSLGIIAICGVMMYHQFLIRSHYSPLPLLVCLLFASLYGSTLWLHNWGITIFLTICLFFCFLRMRSIYSYVKSVHIVWLMCYVMSMSLFGAYLALYVAGHEITLGFGIFLFILSVAVGIKWFYWSEEHW